MPPQQARLAGWSRLHRAVLQSEHSSQDFSSHQREQVRLQTRIYQILGASTLAFIGPRNLRHESVSKADRVGVVTLERSPELVSDTGSQAL